MLKALTVATVPPVRDGGSITTAPELLRLLTAEILPAVREPEYCPGSATSEVITCRFTFEPKEPFPIFKSQKLLKIAGLNFKSPGVPIVPAKAGVAKHMPTPIDAVVTSA